MIQDNYKQGDTFQMSTAECKRIQHVWDTLPRNVSSLSLFLSTSLSSFLFLLSYIWCVNPKLPIQKRAMKHRHPELAYQISRWWEGDGCNAEIAPVWLSMPLYSTLPWRILPCIWSGAQLIWSGCDRTLGLDGAKMEQPEQKVCWIKG